MKSSKKHPQTVTTSGPRGTKLMQSTGVDKSSMGEKSASCLKNKGFGGGANDVSHSISGASVPTSK